MFEVPVVCTNPTAKLPVPAAFKMMLSACCEPNTTTSAEPPEPPRLSATSIWAVLLGPIVTT